MKQLTRHTALLLGRKQRPYYSVGPFWVRVVVDAAGALFGGEGEYMVNAKFLSPVRYVYNRTHSTAFSSPTSTDFLVSPD